MSDKSTKSSKSGKQRAETQAEPLTAPITTLSLQPGDTATPGMSSTPAEGTAPTIHVEELDLQDTQHSHSTEVGHSERRARSASPATLPSDLMNKVNTQIARLTLIDNFLDSLRRLGAAATSEELQVLEERVEVIHKEFAKTHEYLEVTWHTSLNTQSRGQGLATDGLISGMTLAHGVSAPGGLRVPSGRPEVQAPLQVIENSEKWIGVQSLHSSANKHRYAHSSLLATALVQVTTLTDTHQTRILIDPASEITLISDTLVHELKLKKHHSMTMITGVGANTQQKSRGIVYCTLKSITSDDEIHIQAHILPTLTLSLPSSHTQHSDWPHLQGLQLADPTFLTPQPVDIILGVNYYGQIIKPNIIKHSPDFPIAQLSIFGWLILLTKFWVQEKIPTTHTTPKNSDDQDCENYFINTHQRHSSGKYIVRLPLKASENTLGDSYHTAYHCLQRLLRRLDKNQELKTLYTQFMQEYEQLGHMVEATQPNNNQVQYFLPHHGVLRPTSTTTKLRVVFNGSSPTTTGVSLNDISFTGEKIQCDITDVLLWIRQHKYLLATDITKMYRQIMVNPDDWHLQQILWLNKEGQITPFQLTTVTYGTRSAPYLAVRVLLKLVEDEGHQFPLASKAIIKGRYVDDIFGGADTPEQLTQVANKLIELCKAGGFPLAKWHSNNLSVLKHVCQSEDHLTPISFEDCNTKILGLNWNPLNDTFNFSSKTQNSGSKITKRLILSEVAQIFDPLGFVSPTTVRAKMLLQGLWLLKLSWDEQVPQPLAIKWQSIRDDLTSLNQISLPRWINSFSHSPCELHGFSDASQDAMAAAVYLKSHSPSTGPKILLLCAKTKVAPLKKLTIPRLELTAALMLAKLTHYVQATLHVNIHSTYLWTDSSVALTWINTRPDRWKEFVQNRVLQIHDLVPNAHWCHIPGKHNPADCASRGITTTQLLNNNLWWSGPTWLTKSEENWPENHPLSEQAFNIEAKPGRSLVATTLKTPTQWELLERYSTLTKLIRITATIMKATSILRRIPDTPKIITPSDLTAARNYWIKSTQAAYFTHELKTLSDNKKLPPNNILTRLTAQIFDDGILRIRGRLQHSDLDPEQKHPAILPKNSPLTTLIIADAHHKTLHGGVQFTLSTLRQKYWIIGGRYPIKAFIHRCVQCARQRGVTAQQIMGQLPQARVIPSRAFSNTGVDYAGPLTVKSWKRRGAKTHKAWICVFVCMASSAVHLELVGDCTTEGFLAAYRRFISRRGIVHTLYSDCGKNFIGADAEIKRLFTQYTQEHKIITTFITNNGTQWSFNPPATPHMGGKWESVVKSIKYYLNRVVKDHLMTFEELTTLLTQIEALLNSRPLEPLTNDPDDLEALTPGHFLIGAPLTSLPEPTLTDINSTRLNRWQLIQQRTQHFWARWLRSYLQKLQALTKWFHERDDIQVGTLILLSDERFPPSKWPLARVTQLHPGPDGLARVATIKTATTTLTRPIAKLVPLPIITTPATQDEDSSGRGKEEDDTQD